MQIVYLNINGFSGVEKKDCNYNIDMKKYNAKKILNKIFEISAPDILFLAEFDENSEAGKDALKYLADRDYYRVKPHAGRYTSSNYTSIVMAFARQKQKSEISPNRWLKWNEIVMDGYRIVGVHIPDSKHCKDAAEDFWDCLDEHFQKYKNEKVLYIGDMNVFEKGTYGKNKLESIFDTKKARDGWIETGHSDNRKEDFTSEYRTRIDYAILSAKMPHGFQMENHTEFFENKWSDHSAIIIKF